MEEQGKERGQSLVEFALLLPILIIILAAVLDLGRLYYAYVAVTDAAAEGAAYASVHPEAADEDVVLYAQGAGRGLVNLETESTVEVIRPNNVAGEPVTVTVSYSFTVATPVIQAFFPDGTLHLRAVAAEVIRTGTGTSP